MNDKEPLLLACSGDMGSGKTTFVQRLQELLASAGIGPDNIMMPKFADPLYEVMWWFTGEKHRLFLQEFGDLLRARFGGTVLADCLERRVKASLNGAAAEFAVSTAGCRSLNDYAAVALRWFVDSPSRQDIADVAALIRRHFGPFALFKAMWYKCRQRRGGPGGLAPVAGAVQAILCDDMRTMVEYEVLARLNFYLVRIECPVEQRQKRCEASGTWNPGHSTEGKLGGCFYNLVLNNDSDDMRRFNEQIDDLLVSLCQDCLPAARGYDAAS